MFLFPRRIFLALLFISFCGNLFSLITLAQVGVVKNEAIRKNILASEILSKNGKGSLVLVSLDGRNPGDRPDKLSPGVDPCETAPPIGFGETIRGSLSPSDCVLEDGTYADFYVFDGIQGQQVIIDLKSTDFDAYTGIANESGFVLEDDDSGGGTNARIVATLPETGPYAVLANSAIQFQFGSYDLTLSKTPPCTYKLVPTSAQPPGIGGVFSLAVETDRGCHWTAVSNSHPYVRLIDDGSLLNGTIRHNGSGSVNYSIELNDTGVTYSGSIAVAGQTFQIAQPSLVCSYSLSSTAASMPGAESRGQVSVITPEGCPWTLRNNESYMGFDSPQVLSNNRGPKTVVFYMISNNGPSARVTTATIAGQTFTVTQSGLNCTYSLPSTTITAPADDTIGTFKINTQAGCTWGIGGNGVVNFPAVGGGENGSGEVTYHFTANPLAQSRSVAIPFYGGGLVTIPMTFTQAGLTPEPINISGRILGPDGRGIRGVTISLKDDSGNLRTVLTSTFGFYTFNDVMTGYGYLIRASSKRYRFSERYELAKLNMPNIDFFGVE
ncbi:hypothetical protein BH10ACI2_BH10ACI2_25760 [soil metagenome]